MDIYNLIYLNLFIFLFLKTNKGFKKIKKEIKELGHYGLHYEIF